MKVLNSLLLCCMTSFMYAQTARMLIIYKASNQFTAEELAQRIDAHIVQVDVTAEATIVQKLKEEINQLDRANENHRVIIDCSNGQITGLKKKIRSLGGHVGYDYIIIADKELTEAVAMIKDKEETIPLTDEVLPRFDEIIAGRLYDIMMRIDKVFQEHNILYWGTCGTLLGAVRHRGLVPWDDDIDVAILEQDIPKLLALREELYQVGLDVCTHKNGYYKIFPIDGELIEVSRVSAPGYIGQRHFAWRYPSVDVMPMHMAPDGKLRYAKKNIANNVWPKEYFLPQEILAPFVYMPFGPMHMPIPRNFLEIVERMYGEDWNDVAYIEYDHKKEADLIKIKVKLTDRSTVPYILPVI